MSPIATPVQSERGWNFAAWNQWTSLFRRCSWYDFTIIHLAFELSPYKNSKEITFGLLGFHFMLSWCDSRPDFMDDVDEAMKELAAQEGEK